MHPPLWREHLEIPLGVAAPWGPGKNTEADIPSHRPGNVSKWDSFAAATDP